VINGQGFGGWFKQKLCAHAAGRILPLPPERGSVTRSNVRIASATIGLTRVWPAKRAGHTVPRPDWPGALPRLLWGSVRIRPCRRGPW